MGTINRLLPFLMLQLWFQNIQFIQTVRNRTVNNQQTVIPLYKIKDTSFDELHFIYLSQQPIAPEFSQSLKLDSWSQLYPEFIEINSVVEAYSKLVVVVNHFYDLRQFDKIDLDERETTELSKYINGIGLEIQKHFQTVLNSLGSWAEMFPLEELAYLESEEEQEYFKALIGVKDHLFPEPKGDEENYHIELNMEIMEGWTDRLASCTENWNVFILLLYGKYINKYA